MRSDCRQSTPSRAAARTALLLLLHCTFALAQKSHNAQPSAPTGPHPQIEIESPRPASHKSHKKDPAGPTVLLRYRILPGTAGVTAARLEVWDRPGLLTKIPVRVAKSGEVTWSDTSAAAPARLDFELIDPDAPHSCGKPCAGGNSSPEISAVTVAGDDVPPSIKSDPIRLRAETETMSVELDGGFFTSSTKVLLAEPTLNKDIWKAWEFLAVEFVDVTKIRVTIPWTYLASPRKLVLWPFNLDEVETAQSNGLPLNGTEQRTPIGGGTREIIYVAAPASPKLTSVEPTHLAANASEHQEATVILRGSGFTAKSEVVLGRDPLGNSASANPPVVLAPKFISPEALEIQVPASQLRYPNLAVSRLGPIRVWVRNSDSSLQISEPRDIQILPTEKLPAAAHPGEILSIAPSPLPAMAPDGPPAAEVTVIGKNLRANDTILASADQGEKVKLATQFVSPTELRVSVPQALWRDHRVSYRFVIVTPQGERATELYEDEDAPEPETESAPSK
jgi:hypothetical protein